MNVNSENHVVSFSSDKHLAAGCRVTVLRKSMLVEMVETPRAAIHNIHASFFSGLGAVFNPLKTKRICFIQGLSAYRAVNALHFGYKNQFLNVL
jgi:hypothetical protein